MTISTERAKQHDSPTTGCANHDYDLVHELSARLESLWHYDQRIANAEDRPELQQFWRELKRQEVSNIDRLKQLITREIQNECF